MPKPLHPRGPAVVISNHAWLRWQERAGGRIRKRTALAGVLRKILFARMRSGGIQTHDLGTVLDLGNGFKAILRLTDGYWVCTTIISEVSGDREAMQG